MDAKLMAPGAGGACADSVCAEGGTEMDFYEEVGIAPYINAHDTYTVYGGSRMAPQTLEAMAQAARHFVDMEELQRTLGQRIAQMTHNEAAFLCNGASAGMLTAAAVCMARGSMWRFSRLPEIVRGTAGEIVTLHCQHNAYDKAIAASGARVVEVGDADETPVYELEGALNENTAAVFYFASALYARASLPLEEVIRIAHGRGVPVVVDAAAQLPPVDNLWRFTQMGADLVIFSGGKTLCGPQDSGLILGRADLIEDCIRFGAPAHGVCRSGKISREAMAGLYTAIKLYLQTDQTAHTAQLRQMNETIARALEPLDAVARTEIVPFGPVGQTYPRLFAYLKQGIDAKAVRDAMRKAHIYIGIEPEKNAIYISPLNLSEEEAVQVEHCLVSVLTEGPETRP